MLGFLQSREGDWQLQSDLALSKTGIRNDFLSPREQIQWLILTYGAQPALTCSSTNLCSVWTPLPIDCGASPLLPCFTKNPQKLKKHTIRKRWSMKNSAWERNVSELISPGEEKIIFVTRKGCFFHWNFSPKAFRHPSKPQQLNFCRYNVSLFSCHITS